MKTLFLILLNIAFLAPETKITCNKHYIGEFYGGGIIYWLDTTKQHGLITTLYDLDDGSGEIWSNVSINDSITCDNNNGIANTKAIISQKNHFRSAAKLCDDYSVITKYGTFNDWYLPSINELITLTGTYLIDSILQYDGDPKTNGTGWYKSNKMYGKYWSSTACDSLKAWHYYAMYGSSPSKKNTKLKVRAIRKF